MNSYGTVLLLAAIAVACVAGHHEPNHLGFGPVSTQYHSQDEWGQYAYGYSGGPSAKHEQRTADGVTRGGYSYVDANGLVQSLSYVSDPVNGFRVAGTNLPADKNTAPQAVPVVQHAVPVVQHPVPVVQHPVPVVHDPLPAAPVLVHEPVPALPTIVDARHLVAPAPAVHYVGAAPVPAAVHYVAAEHAPVAHPLLKLSKPLTPAGTANLHYPEHAAVYVAAKRKRRSAGPYPYPLLAAVPQHVVTVKHTEFAAPAQPAVVHHLPVPSAYVVPAPVATTSYTNVVSHDAPAPAATSYTNVVRHDAPAPVAHAVYAVPAPVAHAVYAAPAPVPHAVYAAPAPVPHVVVAPAKSQYHAQDEHGQYTYGYTDGASAKTETRYADGMTKGSYSYVDDNGAVQAVHYTAGADGFRAVGTNIPVHHV